jgi:hypothetical protein
MLPQWNRIADGMDDGFCDGVLDGDTQRMEVATFAADGSDDSEIAVIHRVSGSDGKSQPILSPLSRFSCLNFCQSHIRHDADKGRVFANKHGCKSKAHLALQ